MNEHPSTVEEIYSDYSARYSGILVALTEGATPSVKPLRPNPEQRHAAGTSCGCRPTQRMYTSSESNQLVARGYPVQMLRFRCADTPAHCLPAEQKTSSTSATQNSTISAYTVSALVPVPCSFHNQLSCASITSSLSPLACCHADATQNGLVPPVQALQASDMICEYIVAC